MFCTSSALALAISADARLPTLVFSRNSTRPDRVIFPQPSQRWFPRVLPPAILPHSLPKLPDLGGPCPTLRKEVMARLPPAAVTPPALVQLQPLGAGHSIAEEGPDRRVAREEPVVPLGCGLADSPQLFPSEARAPRG